MKKYFYKTLLNLILINKYFYIYYFTSRKLYIYILILFLLLNTFKFFYK